MKQSTIGSQQRRMGDGQCRRNCPPESGGQRHRVLCDDAGGGSKTKCFSMQP